MGGGALGVERDRLLEFLLGVCIVASLGRRGGFEEGKGGVEGGLLRIEFDGVLDVLQGLSAIVLAGVDAGEEAVCIGIVGVGGENGLSLVEGAIGGSSGHKEGT